MPIDHRILRLTEELPPGGIYHLARVHFVPGDPPFGFHTHADYDEVFWVESGYARHHVNGQQHPLTPGDLLLMRRQDMHAFQVENPKGYVHVNLAFPHRTLEYVRRRYFQGADNWPWRGAALPARFALTLPQLLRLREWSEVLVSTQQSLLQLEGFLLDLLNMLVPTAPTVAGTSMPDWLQRALTQMAEPEHLQAGPKQLANLTGRSFDHVSRVIRKCLGKRTVQLVNEMRLEYACRQLRMTNRSITQIAFDCGIDNLSYFHRLFRRHYGMTPRSARRLRDRFMR